MKNTTPNYILKFIRKFPETVSGRKNYKKKNQRIIENLELTRKYIKLKTKK